MLLLKQLGVRGCTTLEAPTIRATLSSPSSLVRTCTTVHRPSLVAPSRQPFSRPSTSSSCLLHPSRRLSVSSSARRAPNSPPHTPHRHHKDLYSVLNVSPKATQQEIKDQFYKLSMLYHPDRNRGSMSAHARFSDITEAYSVLGQHSLRRKYDRGLLQDYPRRPHHDTHHHRDSERNFDPAAMSGSGPKKIYDFDEFYRMHYGEALKWQRERKASQKAMATEQERLATLSEPMHRLLLISVVLSVFFVGWVGAKYRDQQEKEGKWI